MGGPFSSVRAIATRCFSPPDSFNPRSPTIVLIALRQRLHELVDLGEPGCRDDVIVGRVGAAIADVVEDRIVEQHGVLRHDADRGTQRLLRHVANILAVNGHCRPD